MIIVILFLGLILRLISINQSFWLDEATTGNVVKNLTLHGIVTNFAPGDFHPPLYYLIAKLWSEVFGTSEIGLRLMSVFFALGTLYIVYKLSKLASLFLATSGLHLYYSQEARMYAMETFLVALLVFFFVKVLRKRRVGYWLGFALTLPLIFLTDYLPILILLPIWIVALTSKKNFSWWKKFVGSHIILLTSAIWWLPTLLQQLNSGLNVKELSPAWWQTLGKTNLKEILLLPTKFIIGRISFDNKLIYASVVIVSVAIFGYLLIRSLRLTKDGKIFWLWLIVPILIGALIGFRISVFAYFRFLFVLPAFYILTAKGSMGIKSKSLRVFLIYAVLIINLVTSGIYLFNSKFHREDWRGLSEAISKEQNVKVLFPTASQQEAVKYYGEGNKIIELSDLTKKDTNVWLMRYAQTISDPEDKARLNLESLNYKKTQELDFNTISVWVYSK